MIALNFSTLVAASSKLAGKQSLTAMNNVPKPEVSKPDATAPGATTRLGEYETLGILGRGGFSIVYRARDSALGRSIAIKEYMPSAIAHYLPNGILRPKALEYREAFKAGLDTFLHEARLLAQFTHPALVHVYRVWEERGTAFMAMQYCVGKTFRQIRQAEPAKVKDEGWLKATFAPILDALELLHANNCYHRDISPDNILILNGGGPVLLDFGAARQVVGGMTQALTVVLKPGFAPIEQYADDASVQQGPWTDVYGVGAVLYYLVTGKPPLAAVARVVKDPMPKLADSNEFSGVSRSFRQAIDSALTVHSSQRIQSIAQLRQALQLPPSQPQGRFSKTADVPIEVREPDPKPMPPLDRRIDESVPAPQPSGSSLDEPAGTVLKMTIEVTPTVPGKDTLSHGTDSFQAMQMLAFDLEGSEKTPDTPSEAAFFPDSPDSAEQGNGQRSPSLPAGVSWALAFFHLRQGTRIAAKALKRNATLVLKIIAQSSRFRNTVALGLAAVVGFASAFGLLHKPAPDGSRSPSSASSLVQPLANSSANTAMTSGGLASTAQGRRHRTHKAVMPAVSVDAGEQPPIALPKADGGPPITADPMTVPNPPSLVHLSIKPWGQVAVDGQSEGVSPPMTSLSLPPGQHVIFITYGDSFPVYVPVTVPEGEDIVVAYQFE